MLSRSRRPVIAAVATVVTSVLLAACGGGSSGQTDSPAPSSSTADAALKVPAALPTQDLLNNPCAVLSDAQLTNIGLNAPGKLDGSDSKSCSWTSSSNPENLINVGALPQNANGISDIYAGKPKNAYFEPVTVGGYPGVFAAAADLRSHGTCQLWVGVTDQLAASVGTSITSGPNKADPCPIAQKVGEAMIAHLKGAA